MMDALLNSSVEIRTQGLDGYENGEEEEPGTVPAPGQRLLGSLSRASLADNPVYKSKLSRLCTATIDPNGKCLEARGLLKNILSDPA